MGGSNPSVVVTSAVAPGKSPFVAVKNNKNRHRRQRFRDSQLRKKSFIVRKEGITHARIALTFLASDPSRAYESGRSLEISPLIL